MRNTTRLPLRRPNSTAGNTASCPTAHTTRSRSLTPGPIDKAFIIKLFKQNTGRLGKRTEGFSAKRAKIQEGPGRKTAKHIQGASGRETPGPSQDMADSATSPFAKNAHILTISDSPQMGRPGSRRKFEFQCQIRAITDTGCRSSKTRLGQWDAQLDYNFLFAAFEIPLQRLRRQFPDERRLCVDILRSADLVHKGKLPLQLR